MNQGTEEVLPEYKLIVTGDHYFNDYALMTRVIFALADGELADRNIAIVSDMTKGADTQGRRFAREYDLPCYPFITHWVLDGIAAVHNQTRDMSLFSDGLLAFTKGPAKQTDLLVQKMQSLNKLTLVIKY